MAAAKHTRLQQEHREATEQLDTLRNRASMSQLQASEKSKHNEHLAAQKRELEVSMEQAERRFAEKLRAEAESFERRLQELEATLRAERQHSAKLSREHQVCPNVFIAYVLECFAQEESTQDNLEQQAARHEQQKISELGTLHQRVRAMVEKKDAVIESLRRKLAEAEQQQLQHNQLLSELEQQH